LRFFEKKQEKKVFFSTIFSPILLLESNLNR